MVDAAGATTGKALGAQTGSELAVSAFDFGSAAATGVASGALSAGMAGVAAEVISSAAQGAAAGAVGALVGASVQSSQAVAVGASTSMATTMTAGVVSAATNGLANELVLGAASGALGAALSASAGAATESVSSASASKPAAAALPPVASKSSKVNSAQPAVTNISGLPDVGFGGPALPAGHVLSFPNFSCSMTHYLPRELQKYVEFKVGFGAGQQQLIRLNQYESLSPANQGVLLGWLNDTQDYLGCVKQWRNDEYTALNVIINYGNTAGILIEQNRHPELSNLDAPLASRGGAYAFNCHEPDTTLRDATDREIAVFDSCVKAHLDAYDRVLATEKSKVARTLESVQRRIRQTQTSH